MQVRKQILCVLHQHSARRQVRSVAVHNFFRVDKFWQNLRCLSTTKRRLRPYGSFDAATQNTHTSNHKKLADGNTAKPSCCWRIVNALALLILAPSLPHSTTTPQKSQYAKQQRYNKNPLVAQHQAAAETAWSGNNNCNTTQRKLSARHCSKATHNKTTNKR